MSSGGGRDGGWKEESRGGPARRPGTLPATLDAGNHRMAPSFHVQQAVRLHARYRPLPHDELGKVSGPQHAPTQALRTLRLAARSTGRPKGVGHWSAHDVRSITRSESVKRP